MLLDTSGLYCFLDESDPRHSRAVSLINSAAERITHNYIIAELVALCTARHLNRQTTLDFVSAIGQSSDISVEWIEQRDHEEALDLLHSRKDKNYSLCDAVSFVLMRRYNTNEALTTDRHFDQEGFIRLLPA